MNMVADIEKEVGVLSISLLTTLVSSRAFQCADMTAR